MKQLLIIFSSVLVAEIGDKTQLATLLFSTEQSVGRWAVFLAASAALVTSTLIAVLAGAFITRVVPPGTLKTAAGLGFVLVGIWTLLSR
jgi:putative Ca2+/H+ antiporter (TMEM165/GDT1 family)